jgi:hypothetical protein
VQAMQALEMGVTLVHDLERARFGQQQVQHIHIVKLAIAGVK